MALPHADASTFISAARFVLEAKQSRRPGTERPNKAASLTPSPKRAAPRGRRTASRAWDVLMLNARRQAEEYAKALPASEGWPPFLIVCDVGHCFEIYADFTGQGKNYAQFPDRQGFRIYLEELRQENIRERLRLIWLEPHKLDPTKIARRRRRATSRSGWPRFRSISKRRRARTARNSMIPKRWRSFSCAACSRCSPKTLNCSPRTAFAMC